MPRTRTTWAELPLLAKIAIIKIGLLDAGLRAWALADLVERPQHEVHGRKAAWAAGLGLVSSAGLLPAVYLLWARRPH